jgi:hypothetical protein
MLLLSRILGARGRRSFDGKGKSEEHFHVFELFLEEIRLMGKCNVALLCHTYC